MKPGARHGLLLAGTAGPALFSLAVVIAGALRPGYDHVNQFISELGEAGGSTAALMNFPGFMLSALVMLVFFLVLPSRFSRSAATMIGTILLSVFATSVFFAGAYSCDPGCLPDNPSTSQRLHDIASVLAFPAFTLGVVAWGIKFLRLPGWRGFGTYSLVSAALSIVFLVLMVRSEATRDATGLYQRLFLGVLFLWMVSLSIRLWRMPNDGDAGPAA